MQFKRNITNQLKLWKQEIERKPLVVMGARQVGKTTVIKRFGQGHFEHVAYFNFEKQTDIHEFLEKAKSPINSLKIYLCQ